MFQLSENQAQDIVDKMMKDIPYNINIMNAKGIIVGSGTRERVGTIHQGAVKALSTGHMVEVWEDGTNEKQGTNEPIFIGHVCVGVIGITGNPDEVRPFCSIVRTTVSLLIEQRTMLEHRAEEANRKKAFVELLLSHHGAYSQKLRKEATAYQLDLVIKTTVLYVKSSSLASEDSILLLFKTAFQVENDTWLLLVQQPEDVDKHIRRLLLDHPSIRISRGRHEASIASSYAQAKAAMSILFALWPSQQVTTYDEVEFLIQWGQARLDGPAHTTHKLEDTPELLDTLRSFIHHNGSMSLTAESLNIHRNTLQYRLKRIHAITGRDPRDLLQLTELIYELLRMHQ